MKEREVVIGLYRDKMDPSIQCLMLEFEDGGYRLTGTKGCGQWNLIRKFRCEMPDAKLKRAAKDSQKIVGA